jgi:hypothetical protein
VILECVGIQTFHSCFFIYMWMEDLFEYHEKNRVINFTLLLCVCIFRAKSN